MFYQQLVSDRQAALLADAELRRLARQRPRKEPLVSVRLTIEFQLGRRERRVHSHLQSEGG
jgi:hypothetical protein